MAMEIRGESAGEHRHGEGEDAEPREAGRMLLERMKTLASETDSLIEWNDELVSKNRELLERLELLESRGGYPAGRNPDAVAQELSALFREFEQRVLANIRQAYDRRSEEPARVADPGDFTDQINELTRQWEALLAHYESVEEKYEALKPEHDQLEKRYEALQQEFDTALKHRDDLIQILESYATRSRARLHS